MTAQEECRASCGLDDMFTGQDGGYCVVLDACRPLFCGLDLTGVTKLVRTRCRGRRFSVAKYVGFKGRDALLDLLELREHMIRVC